MNLVDSFQNRLKLALSDTTITAFASELGVSKQIISAYVTGTRKPKQLMFSEMAKKLNVSEAWLMGYDVPMERNNSVKEDLSIPSGDNNCEFTDLSEQEKTLIRLFREVPEEGRLEMISEFMAIKNKWSMHTIYRAASSVDHAPPRIEERSAADMEKFRKAKTVTKEEDL